MVDDISHEGLRDLLRKEGVSFQVIKTFKQSDDPDYEAKNSRVPRGGGTVAAQQLSFD